MIYWPLSAKKCWNRFPIELLSSYISRRNSCAMVFWIFWMRLDFRIHSPYIYIVINVFDKAVWLFSSLCGQEIISPFSAKICSTDAFRRSIEPFNPTIRFNNLKITSALNLTISKFWIEISFGAESIDSAQSWFF